MLKELEQAVRDDPTIASVKYLTPERGGLLQYKPNIDDNIANNPEWLSQTRRANRFDQFREQSVAQFRNLEFATLRKIQNDPATRASKYHFDDVMATINGLLDNIQIVSSGSAFDIHLKNGEKIEAQHISSGESELISLAIEVLVFERDATPGSPNLLLMDEPDLHLHPDLQHRYAAFVAQQLSGDDFYLLLATHSTSMVSALADIEDVRISFMRTGDRDFHFRPLSDVHRHILPVFGAHPLSQVFNEAPILLVEGEDDERIWQQAVRSSDRHLRLFPRAVMGVPEMSKFENEVAGILQAIYDNPCGFSLRDGDDIPGEPIDDVEPLVRLRLNCRAAENLLLTDEVLADLDIKWETLQQHIDDWLNVVAEHPCRTEMEAFRDSGFDRRCGNVKSLRNLLIGFAGSNKPWEVVVGKVIGTLRQSDASTSANSIYTYLGTDVAVALLPE